MRPTNLPEPLGDSLMSHQLAEAMCVRCDRSVTEGVRAYARVSGPVLSATWRASVFGFYVGTVCESAVRAGLRAAVADELGGRREP